MTVTQMHCGRFAFSGDRYGRDYTKLDEIQSTYRDVNKRTLIQRIWTGTY
jgi:hypothetical protein